MSAEYWQQRAQQAEEQVRIRDEQMGVERADTQDRLEERLTAAEDEVSRLAKGNRPGGRAFRMTIPVDPKDSDMVLMDGLAAGRAALAALRQSQDIESAALDVKRYRLALQTLRVLVEGNAAYRYKAEALGIIDAALAPRAEEAPR